MASSVGGESLDSMTPGPLLEASFATTATEHFLLFHEPDAGYVAGACGALEHAYGRFYEVFSQTGFDLSRPNDRLIWICFPQKSDFGKYALRVEGMDLSWLDGYYSTLTNRVAIVQPTDRKVRRPEETAGPSGSDVQVAVAANRSPQEGVGTQTRYSAFGGSVLPLSAEGQRFDVTRLTHEVAHQLSFNSGIQKRGVMYPLWISEGLATNFEFDGSVTAGLEHCNAARCKGLLEAYAAGELVPLGQFVVQTTVPPDAHIGRRYYAQAWAFFQFVLTERPENLRTYLGRLGQKRPEHRDTDILLAEFVGAFGSPETLELAWNAFLARLAQQASAIRAGVSTTGCSGVAREL